jgi:hypothetical protein
MSADDQSGDDLLPIPFVADAPDLADPQFDRGFNYDALPGDAAHALRERRGQILKAAKKTTEAMIAIGRDLIAAKKLLPFGQFVQWVQTECGFSIRTAQNYIAIARLSGKCAFVALLSPGAALRLARSRGRSEFVESISRSVGTGQAPTEEEFHALHAAFTRMRALRPKRPRRRSPTSARTPVEKADRLYGHYSRSEYIKLNYEGLKRFGGYFTISIFANIVKTGTVAETMRLVEAELRRVDFQIKLSALSNSENTE